MKKNLLIIVLSLFVFTHSLPILALADNRDVIVYITDTGACYHSNSCSSLSKSKREIRLEDAVKRGYNRCSRCHPPVPDFEVNVTPMPKASSGTSGASSWSTTAPFSTTYSPDPNSWPTVDPNLWASPNLPPISSPKVSNTTRASSKKDKGFSRNWLLIVFPLVALIVWFSIKNQKEKKRAEEEARIEHERWLAEKKKYTDLYGSKTCLELAKAPEDSYIGEDNLPASHICPGKWGYRYTFYITSSKSAYHTADCYFTKHHYGYPINAYNIEKNVGMYHYEKHYPCSRCRPQLPDLTWYVEYRKIRKIKEEYKIPDPDL